MASRRSRARARSAAARSSRSAADADPRSNETAPAGLAGAVRFAAATDPQGSRPFVPIGPAIPTGYDGTITNEADARLPARRTRPRPTGRLTAGGFPPAFAE